LTNSEPYRKISDKQWVITVQENNETKELFLQFPPDALDQVGWDEGDTIIWEELDHGAWSIKKKEEDET
jgi:hypothetical protein